MRVAFITAPIGAALALIAIAEILGGDIWLGGITIAAALFAILSPVLFPAPSETGASAATAPPAVLNPRDVVEADVAPTSAVR